MREKVEYIEWERNQLYVCRKCNRVYQLVPENGVIYIWYLDKDFPKRQDEKTCPVCKGEKIKEYILGE